MAVEAPSNAQWTSFEGKLTDVITAVNGLTTKVDELVTKLADLVTTHQSRGLS